MKFIRATIRPVTTLLLVTAIITFVGLDVLGYTHREIPDWFVSLVSLVVGYWFGSRTVERAQGLDR